MARVVQGQHADDDGETEAPGLLDEVLQYLLVEDVLGHEELGAGLRLATHEAQLWLQRLGVGIAGGADEEIGLAGDRLAGPVDALVEELQGTHQADGADVPDADDVRVAADGGRVAAQAEDVADAQDVGANHVGVDGQGVAVAGGVVHDDLDAELTLEEDGHRQGGHADLGGGAIADVDGVYAGVLEEGGALEDLAGAQAVGRVHLGADDEAAGGQLLAQGDRLGGDTGGDGGLVGRIAHSKVSLADGRRGWQIGVRRWRRRPPSSRTR